MRHLFSASIVAAVCAAAFWTTRTRAADASPFQLVPTAQVAVDGAAVTDVTPVRYGYGWRGYGYYGGWNRPAYGGGYRGGYYRPYSSGYRGYYPYGGYRYGYYPGFGFYR